MGAALAGVAATVFVASFSAAAVTRPEDISVSAASAHAAPAIAQEPARLASLVTPGLSPVAALPKLHLPRVVHHHHHHRHHKKVVKHTTAHVAATPVVHAPAPVATPVPTVAPVYHPPVTPVAPHKSTSKSGSYVGKGFDSKG